jgi:siderophore synthetase component
MTDRTATSRALAVTSSHTEAALAAHAPHLLDGYEDALGAAADTVGRRLRGALVREDIGDARARNAGQGTAHGFDRVEFATSGVPDPVELLGRLDAPGFAAELRNAVVNLAIAVARQRPVIEDGDPDGDATAQERLAVAGHNLHPCGRTRLGWDTTDVLAYDLEAGPVTAGFVAVRDDVHLGDDVGAALRDAYPQLPSVPDGYRLQPVHPWQRDAVLRRRYRDLVDDGALLILDAELPAITTASLRTLLLPPGADGLRRYVKVSLDIQVTSTRRSISVASTRNGPAVSALLETLVAADPDGHRLLLLDETAGAAVPAGSGRDVAAILRGGLTGRLEAKERPVTGIALPFLVPDLVGEYARTTARPDDAAAALSWFDAYARLLLPLVLRLTGHGVALEAHLQNCLPTFRGGVPHRMGVRDFAGLRLHPGRLAAAGHTLSLWPGSVVSTDDENVLRAKIGYTAFQAHLGELVIRLGRTHGLDEDTAWRTVRAVVDETYDGHGTDHAAFTAARVPHKALVRMRLDGHGDQYVQVRNPLHAPA